MMVPQIGIPRANSAVPSTGSMTHCCSAPGLDSPNSSPRIPAPGKRASTWARKARSASMSAVVTRLSSDFASTSNPEAITLAMTPRQRSRSSRAARR